VERGMCSFFFHSFSRSFPLMRTVIDVLNDFPDRLPQDLVEQVLIPTAHKHDQPS